MSFFLFCRWCCMTPPVKTWRGKGVPLNPPIFHFIGGSALNSRTATVLTILEASQHYSWILATSLDYFVNFKRSIFTNFKSLMCILFIFKFKIFIICKHVIVGCDSKNIVKKGECVCVCVAFSFYYFFSFCVKWMIKRKIKG